MLEQHQRDPLRQQRADGAIVPYVNGGIAAADGRAAGDALQDLEFQRYEDWLTGFITGLNLSMGKDVLVGADINGALKRIHAYCQGHGKEDVFTATMDLVRMLGRLK